ncbi:MAG: alkaline phosphatase [Candidatus Azobacteroides sp.]|nr:alkaline phosphatase [Candidatus Azobacteroides sp.]
MKNVIMMIPDGTSTNVLALSRWYKSGLGYSRMQDIDVVRLNIDPFICGLVKTHSSDAPIGDSAPTGSCYATGVVSQTGYIATYPEKTDHDVVPVDAGSANTPAMTILEAAKLSGKSTGLVVTCEFPHATPADFSAHYYSRNKYDFLASQMVHNNIDVVFGGGTDYLNQDEKDYLLRNQWDVITDYNRFKSYSGAKVWGLFAPTYLPYELDRDTAVYPSLREMTEKALAILSKNPNGFFLMIEGSKVDWAAHGNDPAGIVTEFLAFDQAVKTVMDFAEKDGQTAVVICPDHANSGVSIGNMKYSSGYDKLPKNEIIAPLLNCKSSIDHFFKEISARERSADEIKKYFSGYMGINDLTDSETDSLLAGLRRSPGNEDNLKKVKKLVTTIVTSRTCIGFTTTGHTGEDVFLAVYHPKGDIMTGVIHNTEVNRYLQQVAGIGSLADSTKKYFCGHKTLFPEKEYQCVFDPDLPVPTLTVTSGKTKKTIRLKAFDNEVVLNKKTTVPFHTVFVYIDKNKEFYLPEDLKELIDR